MSVLDPGCKLDEPITFEISDKPPVTVKFNHYF